MAHEVETMAYANAVPWHGIGARVNPSATVEEMAKAAGLEWRVGKRPLLYIDNDGKYVSIDRYALVRESDGRILSVVGKHWKPLQNTDMLEFFRDYAEAGGISLETAGSLRGGKIIWALAKMNHSFEPLPGDKVQGYLLFVSPHEAGKAITIRTTTVRVVCANTMAMALRNGEIHWSQNHMRDFDFSSAKKAVENAHEVLAQAANRAKTLTKIKLSIAESAALVSKFFGERQLTVEEAADEANWSRQIAGIMDSVRNAPGAMEGTGWGLLNGVTHWTDHVAGRSAESRMFRSWVGDYSRRKIQLEEELMLLA